MLKNFLKKTLYQSKPKSNRQKKILIAAGHSGGHILPALAAADSLAELDSRLTIEFVHGSSDLEKEIYSVSLFPRHVFSVGRLRKTAVFKERLKTFFSLPWVLIKALYLVFKIKPDLVFGFGSAVSGPIVLAGKLLNKKTVIWEPNAVPGFVSRVLAPFVDQIFIVFEDTRACFTKILKKKEKKILRFPYPLRQSILNIQKKQSLSPPLRVLILGGSQGSFFLNKEVSQAVKFCEDDPVSFVHQTGEKQFDFFKQAYLKFKNVQVFSFLQGVHNFYEWADLVVGRAGAGALAELSHCGRPGIIVPLESSADGHQKANAQALAKKQAVIFIEQKDFTAQVLRELLKGLIVNERQRRELSDNVHKLKLGGQARDIAVHLLSFLEQN